MQLKTILRVLLGTMLVGMGILHFVIEDVFVRMMPPYLPAPYTLNRLAGVFEILGGVGIQIPAVRRLAGWGCVALFLAVYIVNIDMVFRGISQTFEPGTSILGFPLPEHVEIPAHSPQLWFRLPFQFLFIAWALWVTKPNGGFHDTATKM